jgi:hypothetical protein
MVVRIAMTSICHNEHKPVKHKNVQVHDEVQVQVEVEVRNKLRSRQLCSSFNLRIELNQR